MFGEFDRQSGPAPEEVNWEGWTPPWMSREGQGPRGPFGFGRGFGGPRGPFGHRHWFGGPWHGWGHREWQGPRGPFGPGFGPGMHWDEPDELLALRAEAAEAARTGAIAGGVTVQHTGRCS